MRRVSWQPFFLLLGSLSLPVGAAETPPPPLEPGLVVFAVAPDSPAARASIQVGDVLLSYDGTPLVFVSSLQEAQERAQGAKKEAVAVEVRRGEERRALTLPVGEMGLEVGPPLPAAARALWEEGRALPEGASPVARAEKWQAAGEAAQRAGDARAAAWLWYSAGIYWEAGRNFDLAINAYGRAAEQAGAMRDLRGVRDGFWGQGRAAYGRGDWPGARKFWEGALEIEQKRAPDSLDVASILNKLGILARQQDDLEGARGYFQQALAILERRSPDSLYVARSLNNLGNLARQQGDLEESRGYCQRALAILERVAPDSLDMARSLAGLGTVAFQQGNLEEAREFYQRALAIREPLVPDSLDAASSLTYLGNVASQQGDLDTARDYFQRALAILERVAPDSLDMARSLAGLGTVASEQGDLDAARELYQRALGISERVTPDSPAVAASLTYLGDVASEQGDLDAARDYFQRALAIFERQAPNSLGVAASLTGLGVVASRQGDLEGARNYFQRALEIQQRQAPDRLVVAANLYNLGDVALRRGDLEEARDCFQRALEIQQQWAPDSLEVAGSLTGLGDVALRRGDLEGARGYFRRGLELAQARAGRAQTFQNSWGLGHTLATQGDLEGALEAFQLCLDTLESWREVAGREPEERAGLFAQWISPFPPYAALLLQCGRPAEAFHVSERGKARALLDALAQGRRNTGLTDEEVRREAELERNLAMARKALERLQKQPDVDKELLQQQITATVTARQALEVFRQGLYEKHPGLRAGRGELPPLRGEQVGDLPLPVGAVVFSFLVGEEETLVFVLRRLQEGKPVELVVRRLSVEAADLALRVQGVREAVGDLRRAGTPGVRLALRRLSEDLLGPLQDLLEGRQLLLVCPDEFLWEVPWAALFLPGQWEPLIAQYAVSLLPSVTVLDWLLRRPPREQSVPRLLAVGNPELAWARVEPGQEGALMAMRGLGFLARVRDGEEGEGKGLSPLPYAEEEARRLQELYAPQSEVLLGREATEEAVKGKLAGATVLHFATHGVIDEGMPMQSGLLLDRGVEGQEDGKLTAREIMRMDLSAEVAVLSACQTARGRRERGEGILGLSWGFMAAGVGQVVASQWKVADESTAVLMVKFHEGLRAGLGVAEALRRAQTAVRSEERWASPYHWAAFVTVGPGQ